MEYSVSIPDWENHFGKTLVNIRQTSVKRVYLPIKSSTLELQLDLIIYFLRVNGIEVFLELPFIDRKNLSSKNYLELIDLIKLSEKTTATGILINSNVPDFLIRKIREWAPNKKIITPNFVKELYDEFLLNDYLSNELLGNLNNNELLNFYYEFHEELGPPQNTNVSITTDILSEEIAIFLLNAFEIYCTYTKIYLGAWGSISPQILNKIKRKEKDLNGNEGLG